MSKFDTDEYSKQREENLYYPFESKDDWEIGYFFLCSGLSMSLVDEYFKLKLVCISFCVLLFNLVYLHIV